MKKPQWITAGIALLLTLGLYALTQNQLFGYHPKKPAAAVASKGDHEGHAHAEGEGHEETALSVDTILSHAKEALPPDQLTRINFLQNSITRGNVADQKKHVFHQLARFWKDTARIFEPFAWYTAEAARLENSENSLTFAAHLFLDNLKSEQNTEMKNWKAAQAKDLFERSLILNPTNDSTKVGLGATYLFGFPDKPMEGIVKIREVVERDSTNVYAQLTLGQASMVSGQLDRAVDRFQKVAKLEPGNLEAILSLADVYERQGNKKNAIAWYQKSLPLIGIEGLRGEVEKRINDLSK
ncbi:MAG TPA: tetratricopeptide repeat protein [Flavisolibacter sp.]|nr:tetratricopeptide repeat protein [Flavisolibacter sp.]